MIDRCQDSPEGLCPLRIIRAVRCVLIKGNGIGYLDRHSPDVNFDARRTQQLHDVVVKVGHGTRLEWKRFDNAVTGVEHQLMIDEVEGEFERAGAVWDR